MEAFLLKVTSDLGKTTDVYIRQCVLVMDQLGILFTNMD